MTKTSIINRATFIATSTKPDGDLEGTVEMTLHGQTRRVPATMVPKYGWLFARGIIGRYQTGGKTWPGSVMQKADGAERAIFGRDDNHPKFRKENCIWFA